MKLSSNTVLLVLVAVITFACSACKIFPLKSTCKIIDMKEIVCIIEQDKCKIVWFKDKSLVEKPMNSKWNNLYCTYHPTDMCSPHMVDMGWISMDRRLDGLFSTDFNIKCKTNVQKDFKNVLAFEFYNPHTKMLFRVDLEFDKGKYITHQPTKISDQQMGISGDIHDK